MVDRVPEPQLGRNTTIEELQNIKAIGAFRRRRQPEKLTRLYASQQSLIRRRCRMVKLVNHYDVEMVGTDMLDAGSIQTLN